MKTICYLFIFIFEQFISYIYFINKFELKKTNKLLIIAYGASFLTQFLINLTNIPEMNLISFFICNIIITMIFFNCTIKQAIFNVLLLESIMITSELFVMHLTSLLLNIDLNKYLFDDSIIILETAGTKTLNFSLAYIISKISKKEKKNKIKDISFLLFLLPISSIGIIISFTYLSINYNVNDFSKLLFTIISIILLGTNIVVFLVHEKMIITLTENTELQLEKQKEEINTEYYSELEKQYNSSNILIHDIKRCLLNIKDLSYDNENQKIIEYIDSIYEGYEIKKLRQYSNNKLLNLIISRYDQMCYENNIIFNIDIRNVDFSRFNDCDLTGLFGNLLDNSLEAAKNSLKKQIDLVVDKRNEKYIIIELVNTSDNKPQKKGNVYISNKKNSNLHGFGLKSISRIIKRYDGYLNCEYNDELKTFKIVVIFKQN